MMALLSGGAVVHPQPWGCAVVVVVAVSLRLFLLLLQELGMVAAATTTADDHGEGAVLMCPLPLLLCSPFGDVNRTMMKMMKGLMMKRLMLLKRRLRCRWQQRRRWQRNWEACWLADGGSSAVVAVVVVVRSSWSPFRRTDRRLCGDRCICMRTAVYGGVCVCVLQVKACVAGECVECNSASAFVLMFRYFCLRLCPLTVNPDIEQHEQRSQFFVGVVLLLQLVGRRIRVGAVSLYVLRIYIYIYICRHEGSPSIAERNDFQFVVVIKYFTHSVSAVLVEDYIFSVKSKNK
jgi:hypothetical protein